MSNQNISQVLNISNGNICCDTPDATKANIARIGAQIKRFQEHIRKEIEANYVDFLPMQSSVYLYMEEGKNLVRETEHLLQTVLKDTKSMLLQANEDLVSSINELQEVFLGLQVSMRILEIDDLFQYMEEASDEEYAVMLDCMSKLKSLICNDGSAVHRIFEKCACYHSIKVKFQVQQHVLQQQLQQRFEDMLRFDEKLFPSAKCVTLQVSKDEQQLQDIVQALFQAHYNPNKLCDFLLQNCFEPIILKPVSIEYNEQSTQYVQLRLSYSLKELSSSLRPSYKQVFEHMQLLLQCLEKINVPLADGAHVFSILGEQIKERLLTLLVNECLMYALPETMEELQHSTLRDDVVQFEHLLADYYLINLETDCSLSKFAQNFEINFRKRFSKKLLESAKSIMQKDLQDMTLVEQQQQNDSDNGLLFPRCMVSKSTLELIKLLEHILAEMSSSKDERNAELYHVITDILENYAVQVPRLHEKLLDSIPQQSALFYNNSVYLTHWIAKHADDVNLRMFPALVKTLQTTGEKYLNAQIAYQQKLIVDILREFDLSDAHSLGALPLKLIRQCLRQLDLLRNVWQNVLPDNDYQKTFCKLLNDFCADIIRRILALEDISASVASELSELIELILDKAPTLFKQNHDVLQVNSWMKLQQLKMILNASLQSIVESWCDGAGILTVCFKAEELKHLIRALFQNTDRRAKALAKIT